MFFFFFFQFNGVCPGRRQHVPRVLVRRQGLMGRLRGFILKCRFNERFPSAGDITYHEFWCGVTDSWGEEDDRAEWAVRGAAYALRDAREVPSRGPFLFLKHCCL